MKYIKVKLNLDGKIDQLIEPTLKSLKQNLKENANKKNLILKKKNLSLTL